MMAANGADPEGPTPRWWRISIFAHPLQPGTAGLEEYLRPVVAALAELDRQDERVIIIVPDPVDHPRRIHDDDD